MEKKSESEVVLKVENKKDAGQIAIEV